MRGIHAVGMDITLHRYEGMGSWKLTRTDKLFKRKGESFHEARLGNGNGVHSYKPTTPMDSQGRGSQCCSTYSVCLALWIEPLHFVQQI